MVEIAGEIHIIILGFISSLIVILLSLGYVYRTSFPMSFMWFLSGAIFLMIFLLVNTITIDDNVISTNSTSIDNTTNTDFQYQNVNYDIKVKDINGNYTAEPTFIGIMLLMLSLCFIMIGILIEKFN